jgi:hypothetical protein
MLSPLIPLPKPTWPASNGDPPAATEPANDEVVAELLWDEGIEGTDGEGEVVPDVDPDPLLDVDPEFCGLRWEGLVK